MTALARDYLALTGGLERPKDRLANRPMARSARTGKTAGSPGRIEKQIALRQGARHRTANRFAAVVHSVHTHAIDHPVLPLNAVNHRLAAEGVNWHVLEMLGNKL